MRFFDVLRTTTASRGQHLAGATELFRIEHVPDLCHHQQVRRCEQAIHQADFFHADPMFARHAAAKIDAAIQDFVAGQHDSSHLIRIAFIEQQDRMYVSIPGVKHVDNPQPVPLADFVDELQNLWQLRAWHYAILSAITGAQSANRPKGLLARFPEQESFFLRPRLTNFSRTGFHA